MKKRIVLALIIVSCVLFLTACGKNRAGAISTIETDSSGTVSIPIEDIGSDARFYNYDADGVTVQLVALRDNSGEVHIAFNTCQSCSPSPKAYYQQEGGVLKCTNCGFTFRPEEVGMAHGGCNPWPIDGVNVGNDVITVPVSSLDNMRSAFISWKGITR